MKKANKTSDQIRQEAIDAMDLFIKNLKEFLRKGTYEIKSIYRDYDTNEIKHITLDFNGHLLFLRRDEGEIHLQLPFKAKGLINPQLIDEYNRLSIDDDIRYHEEALAELRAQKAKLAQAALQKIDEDDKGS